MLEKAITIATQAHEGQKRKGSGIPYIFHPLCVGAILAENGCSMDVIVAGILHDTIEDTFLTAEDIRDMFGQEVMRLVTGASEGNRDVPGVTWRDRKQHTVDFLKTQADLKIKQVTCADKLHNIRSFRKDVQRIGERLWDKFNAPYEEQRWYYQSLVDCFDGIHAYAMYKEFTKEVCDVFGGFYE